MENEFKSVSNPSDISQIISYHEMTHVNLCKGIKVGDPCGHYKGFCTTGASCKQNPKTKRLECLCIEGFQPKDGVACGECTYFSEPCYLMYKPLQHVLV